MPFDISSINETLAPILSSFGTLRESLGWQGFAVVLMLLPIVRILIYAFVSPLGTILNALAAVFGMLLQASVQIVTASTLALSQIVLSWIQVVNASALKFSNYILLLLVVVGSVLAHSFFIKQSPNLQTIAIDTLCTFLVFALHKLYSLYSSSKSSKRKKEELVTTQIEMPQPTQPNSSKESSKDSEILFGKRLA